MEGITDCLSLNMWQDVNIMTTSTMITHLHGMYHLNLVNIPRFNHLSNVQTLHHHQWTNLQLTQKLQYQLIDYGVVYIPVPVLVQLSATWIHHQIKTSSNVSLLYKICRYRTICFDRQIPSQDTNETWVAIQKVDRKLLTHQTQMLFMYFEANYFVMTLVHALV